jgi:4-hydroxy-2-oxoheptanedioate aldolase
MIRERLKNGERVYGTHVVSLGSTLNVQITAAQEMDFVFICTEHVPLDRTEVGWMCQLYASRGISPIVRIPYPAAHWACMAIDSGAQGIVAPYVETVEQVKALVGAVKCRPIKGKFMRDLLDGHRKPSPKLSEYFKRFSRDQYLIIGVESVEAIENLEALISIEGVDGVFLGPHDITCSMELPEEYDNPKVVKTILDVVRRTLRMKRGVGIHMDLSLPLAKPYLDAGMNFLLDCADVAKLRDKLGSDLRALRTRLGDPYQRMPAARSEPQTCSVQKAPKRTKR